MENAKKQLACVFAAMLLAASLSGCTSERGNESAAENTSSAAETEAETETEAQTESESEAETEPETTAPDETETEAPETTTEADSEAETEEIIETKAAEPAAPALTGADGDTRILWSERGLQAVSVQSEDGYGEELKVGTTYLNWKLNGFNGVLDDSAQNVESVDADFTYNGTLSVNGIVTVLPADHPDQPNMLYLRVDNQAEFPYFPQDTRERGKFIIENSADVFRMLGLDDPPVASQYDVAVSVSVTTLHVHMKPGSYDTIRVTGASKR